MTTTTPLLPAHNAARGLLSQYDAGDLTRTPHEAVEALAEALRDVLAAPVPAVIVDAASSWRDELHDYIIPNASAADDNATSYRAEADALEAALSAIWQFSHAAEAQQEVEQARALTVAQFPSEIDGAAVVQIDTTPALGPIRIYLNDACLFHGDPETGNLPEEPSLCNACDRVEQLSKRGLCRACNALPPCDECGLPAAEFYDALKAPVKLCSGCDNDARRSGWEPGR